LFGIGFQELLVVLVIILIVFGVGKLPQIGEGLGKAIKGFKRGVEAPDEDEPDKPAPRSSDTKP
jgi:sec-independent protein translocase protein TatA